MTWTRVTAARWRRCLDGVLVLSPSDERAILLRPPGDVIWQLLASPRTSEELVEQLVIRYDADAAVIETELMVFLDELTRHYAVESR